MKRHDENFWRSPNNWEQEVVMVPFWVKQCDYQCHLGDTKDFSMQWRKKAYVQKLKFRSIPVSSNQPLQISVRYEVWGALWESDRRRHWEWNLRSEHEGQWRLRWHLGWDAVAVMPEGRLMSSFVREKWLVSLWRMDVYVCERNADRSVGRPLQPSQSKLGEGWVFTLAGGCDRSGGACERW